MKVDGVAPGVIHFVHHPEAAAVDRALVHFEFTRQLLRIDLLVVVRANREGCRRIDVSPLGLADADKGAESAERGTAGVVGVDSASGACFQFHGFEFSHLSFGLRDCSCCCCPSRSRRPGTCMQVVADDRRPAVALRGVGHQIFLKHFGLGRPDSDRGESVRSAFQVRHRQGASTLTSSSVSRQTPGLSCLAQPTLQRC